MRKILITKMSVEELNSVVKLSLCMFNFPLYLDPISRQFELPIHGHGVPI